MEITTKKLRKAQNCLEALKNEKPHYIIVPKSLQAYAEALGFKRFIGTIDIEKKFD